MKSFNGKAIYNPSGKAGEYSYWACNFYNGCSNGCTYCYLKKGVLKPTLGGDKPTLKKCFKNEGHALEIFEKELLQNKEEIQKHGLFFSFTTDPLLKECAFLTHEAMFLCFEHKVPVKILTKMNFSSLFYVIEGITPEEYKYLAVGFTLTGHDELEPNASSNDERIEAMKEIHRYGIKTFASIEPIIDFESSRKMIEETLPFCDLYKIGLESGKRYPIEDIHLFLHQITLLTRVWQNKIYYKDSFIDQAKVKRCNLPDNCVERDYNLFGTYDLESLKQLMKTYERI